MKAFIGHSFDEGDAQVIRKITDFIESLDIVEKFKALHIPTHEIYQRQLQYRPADTFCPEPVHPNQAGHIVIANAWLEAVGW